MMAKTEKNPGAGAGGEPGLQVVFGTGPVGWAAIRELANRGLRVRAVNRSGRLPATVVERRPEGLEVAAADAMDPAAVRSVSAGATHIYNCAHARYDQFGKVLPVLYGNLADAAIAHGAVLATAQNLYLYARGLPVIDDASPVDPPSRKGRIIQKLQEGLEEAGARRGLRWTVVRSSDFYGPGSVEQSLFGSARFLDPLSAGRKPTLIGDPDQPHTYTYVGDYGRALVSAALSPEAHGSAWIVPNDRTITTRQMAGLFFSAAGRDPGFSTVPRFMLVLAGLVNPVIREIPEMLYQREEPYVVDGSRFASRFGFAPTSLEDGVRLTLQWHRAWRAAQGGQAHGERAA